MKKARSYKICRNCRHVEIAEARVGDTVKYLHICRGRRGQRYLVVAHDEHCPGFLPRTLQVPEFPAAGRPDAHACLIPLSKGMFALVDEPDYRRLAKHKWHARHAPHSRTYYAIRSGGRGLMHRIIMNPPPGMQVDHINHNGLDNRRANLRICTSAQNLANRRPSPGKTSRYKGVCWDRSARAWYARIRLHGKTTHLGYFKNEKHAAHAYDRAARQLHGKFACPNLENQPHPPNPRFGAADKST